MENQQPSNGRKASMEEELIRGRDTANQLLEVIVHKSNTNCPGDFKGLILPFAEDLVRKVLRSFTNTLLLLNSTNNNDVFDDEVLPISVKDLSPSNCSMPDHDADKARERFFNAKNRRGCYKRKSNALTWEKDSSILIDDGYIWRKYGQKKIMNVKYLRSYYRCTYKDEQDCPAVKQVQKIQEEPPLYRTTYYGHHTCKSSLLNSLEPNTSSGSSTFLSFNSSLQSKEQYSFSSSLFASTKQEHVEVIPYYDIAHNQYFTSSADYSLSCDYELHFDYLNHATMLSSTESVPFDDVCGPSLDFDCKACFAL